MQNSRLGNASDPEHVEVNFYHNALSDPTMITSKTVTLGKDAETRYRYVYGLPGNRVAEYRGDITGTKDGQVIEQTYDASQDGGYTVVKSAWQIVGTNTINTSKTTSRYGDVNNK